MKDTYGAHVSVALDGRHVAIVEIDAPPHNFANVEMIRGLAEALEALDLENDCRAVVLAATGKSFCAGADLGGSAGLGAGGMPAIRELYENGIRLFATQKPIVAAIQGAAVGAGLGLAMIADFRVAAPEARFTANFVKLGFHPGFGLTETLPRAIGRQRAALLFLTGRRIKADQALEWGLADQVVPLQELRTAAGALAREIAENAPLAVVATRETIRGDLAGLVRARTAIEFEKQSMLRVTDDYAEGVLAVAERRPGNFAGR
ncbi:enoyl-CoA hydratase/isomerase family protein [Phenylobacterium sp.]|uniref:enoyl-CoA hydratase/isomerase family protein n=1 Tax=Phenylobacterium sp. TaxID=1871053 RepID=UPI002736FDB5|nr:enoyl-CoA hydratase/isomerase family protein [Phenylobacterium sp.]MDP3658653.1 enoyl-CoA hydratase/isomerase family protein [Phenylobacterium sp.]